MTKLHYNLLILFLVLFSLNCSTQKPVIQLNQHLDNTMDDALPKAVNDLSTQISETLIKQQKSKVAVMPFTTLEGRKTKIGIYLSDKLTNSLFKYQTKFEVVDRLHLEKVLEEMKLGMSGWQNPETIQHLGQMLGADAWSRCNSNWFYNRA